MKSAALLRTAIAITLVSGASTAVAASPSNMGISQDAGFVKNANDPVLNVSISQNTPGFIKNAKDLGPTDPNAVISVTAWLKLHNEQQLDQLVKQQTTKGNANFHKWITQDQFNAQFSPTANELNAVQNWLNAHKLTTLAVAENNFYVKVQGTVADVEKAFRVSIDNFQLSDGSTYRSNTGNPSVNDSSGNHIAAITGLDDYGFQPQNVTATGPDGEPYARKPLTSTTPNGAFFSAQCFRPPETDTFTDADATATYSGNRYGADISNTSPPNLPPCGYQPSEVQTAYNMGPLYTAGFDGTGETIVIVDAYGSPTIQQDAALFSQVYGLPPVNLNLVKAPGLANNPHAGSWVDETTLDVEWSHAMAPGANIALVVATDRSSLDEAINLAVVHHLGNTISNSWSSIEGFGNPAQLGRVERILEMAAAQGVDVNFSSGDYGDETVRAGFVSVDYPASSTFATGIGGTSLALNADNTVMFETGWGNNQTRIAKAQPDGGPYNPPVHLGFQFGAGGGSSLTFPKPSFQSSLSGTMRQVPDISMLADPFTGVEIIITDPAQGPSVGVIGGTSLACPLFSGVMAIAAQKAGHGLGQAAPLLYGLAGVRDIVPPDDSNNVSGTITPTGGSPISVTSDDLISPETAVPYLSALYNGTSTRWYALSFNTDTSLTTGTGWDNITGVGVPDGVNFVNAIAP
jgi:subtilase family serine protease